MTRYYVRTARTFHTKQLLHATLYLCRHRPLYLPRQYWELHLLCLLVLLVPKMLPIQSHNPSDFCSENAGNFQLTSTEFRGLHPGGGRAAEATQIPPP